MTTEDPKRIEQAWQDYLAAWAKSVYGASGSPRDIGREARDRSRAAFVAGWHARGRSDAECPLCGSTNPDRHRAGPPPAQCRHPFHGSPDGSEP